MKQVTHNSHSYTVHFHTHSHQSQREITEAIAVENLINVGEDYMDRLSTFVFI